MWMTVRPCNRKAYQDEEDTVAHDLIRIRENKGKNCDSDSDTSDMILEILSHISFAMLDVLKTVSMDCRRLVYVPGFACFHCFHCKNTKSLYGYFIQGINLMEENRSRASCYKGIVLCEKWNLREYNYLVGKLETLNWELLPNPNEEPTPLWFKVVMRISHPTDDSKNETHTILRVDIFNSKLGSWSERYFLTPQQEVRVNTRGVLIHGISACCSIYWLNHDHKGIAFNRYNGSPEKFHLPYFRGTCEYKRLQEFQGRIGLVLLTKDFFASALTMLMTVRPCNRKAYQDEEDTRDLIEKKGKTCDTDSAIDSLLGLPWDMILEILSRTSFAALDVLKTVSRDCRNLIYSPGFASFHCKNANSLYGYFIQGIRLIDHLIEDHRSRRLSRPLSMFFSFEQPGRRVETDGFIFLASCYKGIVLCEKCNLREHNYFVGKPETQNWEPLPFPDGEIFDNFIFAIGIVVMGSWFKVVRFMIVMDPEDDSKNETHHILRVDIFNSKLGSWSEKYFVTPQEELRVNSRGVFIHGISAGCSIYWLNHDDKVIVYNGYNESIDKIPLPYSHGGFEYKRLQEFQGRIGLVVLTKDGKLELWQMDGNSLWYKRIEPLRRVETEGITFLASCYKGIILCEKWNLSEYNCLVVKPETLNCEPLPDPDEEPFENITFAIGIVVLGSSTPLWCKVVRLVRIIHLTDDSKNETHTILSGDIFDSKLGSWNERYFLTPQQEVRINTRGVLIHGISACCSIYWLNHDDKGMAFNGYNESLQKFHLPYFHGACEYRRLQEFQVRIGLVVLTKDFFASALTMLMTVRPCNRKAYQDEEDTVAHDLIRIREKKGKTWDSDSAMDSLLGLPSDMILEILSRTSFATLDVLKTVSRDCRHLIYSPGFASFHYKNTKSLYGYLIQGINLIEFNPTMCFSRPLPLFFSFEQPCRRVETEGLTVLASCYKGIVLCEWNLSKCCYHVGKPETLNWEPLPDPDEELLESVIFAIGIVVLGSSTPLWFKVVRLMRIIHPTDHSKNETHTILRVDIFDSKLGSWSDRYSLYPQEELSVNARGILIPGISAGCSIYWLNHAGQGMAFNGYNESLGKFNLPYAHDGACEYKRLQEFQGSIGLVVLTKDGKLELWQIDGNYLWYKRMEVNIYHLQTRYHFNLFGFHNEEMVYMKAADVIVFYDLNNLVLKHQVKLDSGLESACNVFQYRSA